MPSSIVREGPSSKTGVEACYGATIPTARSYRGPVSFSSRHTPVEGGAVRGTAALSARPKGGGPGIGSTVKGSTVKG